MGRWYYHKKGTVKEALDLTVFQLKNYGMLKACYHTRRVITWVSSRSGKESSVNVEVNMINDASVKLLYSISDTDGNNESYDCEITLITSPCNYGGLRYWFACPACHRRVVGIYLAPGNSYFRCRHCSNLTYRSRTRDTMTDLGHTSRQIEKLRRQIKRWTWRGRPTRKVRKLNALEGKESALLFATSVLIDKMESKIV